MASEGAVTAEALAEYLAECEEILSRISSNLSRLEKGGCDVEMLDELYRDIHTMKGSAQLFGFRDIATVAHAMESCMDPIRRNRLLPSKALMDSIFKSID